MLRRSTPPPDPRGRPYLVGGLLFLLLLAGLATFNRGLLALAIPLAVYLGAALLGAPGELRLEARRSLAPERASGESPISVKLSISNRGTRPEHLEVRDPLPSSLVPLSGKPYASAVLAPGAMLELEYTVTARRGFYDLAGVTVIASDPLGLWQRQRTLPAPGQVVVLPQVVQLRRLPIRPARTHGHAGPVPARLGGSGTDFFGVREYQIGDPRRWINWRASGRHPDTLFTNQFQQERIADVGIILDGRVQSDLLRGGESLFEHSIGAAAALADLFLRDGNRVGLLVFGQYLDWTFPGYGKLQRERILQALARAQTGDSQVFERLEYLPTRFFPPRSQIVLVSPVAKSDVPALVRLRALGYQLLIVRPDPIAFERQGLARGRSIDLAARVLQVERLLVRRWLHQVGVQVVDWQVDLPFDQAVHTSLVRVTPWFRMVKGAP